MKLVFYVENCRTMQRFPIDYHEIIIYNLNVLSSDIMSEISLMCNKTFLKTIIILFALFEF